MADKGKEKSILGLFGGRARTSDKGAPAPSPAEPQSPVAEPESSNLGPAADARDPVATQAAHPEPPPLAREAASGESEDVPRDLIERAAALERELIALRDQSTHALAEAEERLGAAARRIEEVDEIRRQSQPPPPTELNELRTRNARLLVELTELRADRDEQKRQLEAATAGLESSRVQLQAVAAQQAARDARLGLLESGVQASNERARLESARADEIEARRLLAVQTLEQSRQTAGELTDARDRFERDLHETRERLQKELLVANQDVVSARGELQALEASSRAAARAAAQESEAKLQAANQALAAQRTEAQSNEAALRSEIARVQTESRERETQLLTEVHQREATMVAEVQSREAKLVEMAQSREKQLIAEAEGAMMALAQEKQELVERASDLEKALAESREREATLEAEARLKNSETVDEISERELQLEDQLEAARRDARLARDGADELVEAKERAETRVAELQATVDSLGLERAALRAEAGQVRAQLELNAAVEKRAHQLLTELEELRGENDFLNQEMARYASAAGKPPPLPVRKRKD